MSIGTVLPVTTVTSRTGVLDRVLVPATSVVSGVGVVLERAVVLRFALDPTRAQWDLFTRHAGAARYAVNHHLGRVRATLDQRRAERFYGVGEAELTPSLSWSKIAFIDEFNTFKTGRLPSSPVDPLTGDGGPGLAGQVNADVFECACADAAQALSNVAASRSGARVGVGWGLPGSRPGTKARPRSGCGPSPRRVRRRRCALPGRKVCDCRVSGWCGCTAAPARVPGCGSAQMSSAPRPVSGPGQAI
jgi:hypothetical protein